MTNKPKNTDKKSDKEILQDYIRRFKDINLVPMKREIIDATVRSIDRNDVRSMIDQYYQIQERRKELGNQIFAIEHGEDVEVKEEAFQMIFMKTHFISLQFSENNAKNVLQRYALTTDIGKWANTIVGIGPVITAALIGYIDIDLATNVGKIYRYAGIDPTRKWLKKDVYRDILKEHDFRQDMDDEDMVRLFMDIRDTSGWKMNKLRSIWDTINYNLAEDAIPEPELYDSIDQLNQIDLKISNTPFSTKRDKFLNKLVICPWNKRLKVICYHIGESFIKSPRSYYHPFYKQRKDYEIEKNMNGDYAEQAELILQEKKFDKSTEAYKAYSQGRLPKAHIHARARRKAVQIFLSHFHAVWRSLEGYPYNEPFVMTLEDHSTPIPVPNYDFDTKKIFEDSNIQQKIEKAA